MALRITHLFGNNGLAYAPRLLNVKAAHRALVHKPFFFFVSSMSKQLNRHLLPACPLHQLEEF